MPYPYPEQDAQGHDADYSVPLSQTTKTRNGATFCTSLDDIKVIRFDDVRKCFDPCRKESYSSADALFLASDGRYFFIEFKHDSYENLMRQGRKGDPYVKKQRAAGAENIKQRQTIQVVMHKKAVDSLAVAALSVLREKSMREIQGNAVFITVHDASPALKNMARNMRRLASSTTNLPETAPLWGLQDLQDAGFYRKIYTWDETEFCEQARSLLR